MNILVAMQHHFDGRLAQAESMYRAVLAEEPDNADAPYFLGLMAREQGNVELAMDFMRRAVTANPSGDIYLNALAGTLAEAGRDDEAEMWFRRALGSNPKCVGAWIGLAAVLQRNARVLDAVACYEQALSIDPDNSTAHNDSGVALLALGRSGDAVRAFECALVGRPDFAEAHNNLGVACKMQNEWGRAIECYFRALDIRPDYPEAWLNLGMAFQKKRDHLRALDCFRASLQAAPDQIGAHQAMAASLFELDRPDEAQEHRDIAYRRQAVFVDAAPTPKRSVLLLWAAGKGNIPVDTLLPAATTTRITWMMEYATAEQERALPRYDVVLNAIGDPDASGPTAAAVAGFLSRCARRVLNAPAAVARTRRDAIPVVLGSIPNTIIPPTIRFATPALKQALPTTAGLRFPLLIRPAGSHGGDDVVLLESAEQLAEAPLRKTDTYYASNYVDYRSPDGCYRKYRIVFVDRKPLPYHLAIGAHWMVHYETAGMAGVPWKQAEEASFLADPWQAIGTPAMEAVSAIGRILDLDYCGVDFSLTADGQVLVFEANPTMLVHLEERHADLQYKNPFVQRIFDAFEAMVAAAADAPDERPGS